MFDYTYTVKLFVSLYFIELYSLSVLIFFKQKISSKQEAHRPKRSPEYHRLYTDFLSEGLRFVYQQPHHRINENQQWYRKAAS